MHTQCAPASTSTTAQNFQLIHETASVNLKSINKYTQTDTIPPQRNANKNCVICRWSNVSRRTPGGTYIVRFRRILYYKMKMRRKNKYRLSSIVRQMDDSFIAWFGQGGKTSFFKVNKLSCISRIVKQRDKQSSRYFFYACRLYNIYIYALIIYTFNIFYQC